MLIELFSLGLTAEALGVNIVSKSAISLQRWPVHPKFQVEGAAPADHSSSRNTRLNDFRTGPGSPDRMLAAPWRRLFLVAFWAIPSWYLVVAVLRDSIGISLLSCLAARCG